MAMVMGIDGCPGGWIAVIMNPDAPATAMVRVAGGLAELVAACPSETIIAVDMPIGLPARVGPGGRQAEATLRPRLGARQSSVFSVPSRSAVEALTYAEACIAAAASSDPPRKVSKQSFFLFPKIREVDAFLRADAALAARVFESHPEGVFMVLNGGQPLSEPKKMKSRPWPAGLDERRALLTQAGLPASLVTQAAPRGASADDLLDACACTIAARRILRGEALSFPPEPTSDAFGLTMAIRV